jgi:hypothetical protein
LLASAFTSQDLDPAADFVTDARWQGLDPVVDRLSVRVDSAHGIGNDKASLGEELQHPAAVERWSGDRT